MSRFSKPTYKLVANGEDKTAAIAPYLISLSITDNQKDQADELRITVGKKFARPAFGDEIKVYLGDATLLQFVGAFYVQKTSIVNNQKLVITATGVDFSKSIKERRQQRYEQITPIQLAKVIADRHGLRLRSTIAEPVLDIEQHNESDLNLLNRLAKEYSWVFNIKNNTLYLTYQELDPPQVNVAIATCIDSEITHSSTKLYKSCQVVYQDTRTNKKVTVIAGEGKPVLFKRGHFDNEALAQQFAENALKRASQGTGSGRLTITGQVVFAGATLNVDNQQFTISRVEQTVHKDGWQNAN